MQICHNIQFPKSKNLAVYSIILCALYLGVFIQVDYIGKTDAFLISESVIVASLSVEIPGFSMSQGPLLKH